MIKILKIYGSKTDEYNSAISLKKKTDEYDNWLLEGNPELKKNDLKHEVYFERGSFIFEDESGKLYDANEYYKALYENKLSELKELVVLDIKRQEFFELTKTVYED